MVLMPTVTLKAAIFLSLPLITYLLLRRMPEEEWEMDLVLTHSMTKLQTARTHRITMPAKTMRIIIIIVAVAAIITVRIVVTIIPTPPPPP